MSRKDKVVAAICAAATLLIWGVPPAVAIRKSFAWALVLMLPLAAWGATDLGFYALDGSFSVSLAATNDVAQCWAATQSGNRCKRRAAVGMRLRYCRQHASAHEPTVAPDRCRSMTTNGIRCAEAPLPKRNYCQKHTDAPVPRP